MNAISSPKAQLERFIAKFPPAVAIQARAVLDEMRSRLPGAIEMVYDNYRALVIGYSPSERSSDAIFSIVVIPRWVGLCFLRGAMLPDPCALLRGGGNVVRHIRLESRKTLDEPAVRALSTRALDAAETPMDNSRQGHIVIRSISAKQLSRRPPQQAISNRTRCIRRSKSDSASPPVPE